MSETKSAVPECCAVKENLERVETTNPDTYILRCKVCSRNHWHAIVRPLSMALRRPMK